VDQRLAAVLRRYHAKKAALSRCEDYFEYIIMYAEKFVFVGFVPSYCKGQAYTLSIVLHTDDDPGWDHAGGTALKRKSQWS
jgi:hypothetical protein